MMTVCMLIYSLHIQIVYGGTGDGLTDSMVRDGDLALAGTLHGIHHGTRLGIMVVGIHHGTQVIGEDIGDRHGIITIIIRITDGTVDGIVRDIQTTDRADISHIIEVALLLVLAHHIPDVHSLRRQ